MKADNDLYRSLARDARLVEVRMPEEMTFAEVKRIRESLRDFMSLHGLKQADVYKAIGVSSSQVSQFLDDKYKGDLKLLCNKLVNYINSYTAKLRRGDGQNGFVRTTVAKLIGTVIRQTEAFSTPTEGKIGIIIGDAGHGKSVCLKQYAEANKNSVYIELDDTMTSTAIFTAIAKAVLKKGVSGSLKTLTKRLAEALEKRYMIIMLDEASALDTKKLSQLRQVITVRCKCPLILAANNHLLWTINQDSTKLGYESLDQFKSRVLFTLNLDKLAVSRNDGLYRPEDIRKLYEHGGIRLDKSAVEMLRAICRAPQTGRLRTCSHIIEALRLSPKVKPNQLITQKEVMDMIEYLGLLVDLPTITGTAKGEKQEAVAKTA